MGVLGNYQLSPDRFRERGYSGYIEWKPLDRAAVGLTSLVTHAAEDLRLHTANTRQVHGLFARFAPVKQVAFLAEGDLVLAAPSGLPSQTGTASMLQADVELVQGLHFIATGETWTPGGVGRKGSFGGWAGVQWFFAPHTDLRFDYLHRSMGIGPMTLDVAAYVIQLHLYL